MLDAPTIGMLGSVAGLAFIVTIVTEIILRAAQPSPQAKDRYGPLLALGTGAVFSIAAAVVAGAPDFLTALLTAVVAAGTGMGIHDTVDSLTTSSTT